MKALREVMKAFRAAVQQAGSDDSSRTKYSVDGSAGKLIMYDKMLHE